MTKTINYRATYNCATKTREVRQWIVAHIDIDTMTFPSEDSVWEFITTHWPMISTEHAETLLHQGFGGH